MGAITHEAILTPVKLLDSNEGGQAAVDVRNYRGDVDFILQAKSDAGSSPTLDVKLQASDLTSSALNYEVSNTANVQDVELREGATTNVKVAASFTTVGAIQVNSIILPLKKNGTVSATNITLTIEGDSSGPDDSALGTATVSTDNISASYDGVAFTFSAPVELSATTKYWIVIASDYSESGTNNIAWKVESGLTSGGNQSIYNGTSWSADADDSHPFTMYEYAFADITGGAFTQVTTTGSVQKITLKIDDESRYVRAHTTVGGTSTPAFYGGVSILGFKDS